MVHGSRAMKQRVLWDRVVTVQPLRPLNYARLKRGACLERFLQMTLAANLPLGIPARGYYADTLYMGVS